MHLLSSRRRPGPMTTNSRSTPSWSPSSFQQMISVVGPRPPPGRQGSIILQQPLDIVELDLRAVGVGQAPAELFEDAADALDVDLARDLHREIVAQFAAVQGPAERVGLVAAALLTAGAV